MCSQPAMALNTKPFFVCSSFFCSRIRRNPYAQKQSPEVTKRDVRVTTSKRLTDSGLGDGGESGESVMMLEYGKDFWVPWDLGRRIAL